jgi:putative PIN family toxin of toxin-antitoxin system
VVVSSFFGGKPREIINLWRDLKFALCLTDEILAEYLEVIARFGQVKEEVREFLSLLDESENVVFVNPAERIHVVTADPEDNKFLECAVVARAAVIVSGDQHLLDLKEFRGIPILEPAKFLRGFMRT